MATEFINGQWRIPNSWNVDESNQNKISNYSMKFNGTSDVVRVDETQLTGYSSVSLWFKTSAVTSSSNIDQLLGSGDGGVGTTNAGYFQYLSIRNNKIVNYGGSGIGYFELASTAVNDGAWHNLILTYDPTTAGGASRGTLKAYLDGTLTSTTDTNGYSINWTSSTLRTIGNYGTTNTNRPFDGTIDQVSLFDYELSQAQVTTLYGNSAAGYFQIGNPMALTPNPVAFYPLGDQDLIGAGYNGANWLVPNQVAGAFSSVFTSGGSAPGGSSATIDLANPVPLGSNKTVSFWFKLSSSAQFNFSPFTATGADAGNCYYPYFITSTSTSLKWYVSDANCGGTGFLLIGGNGGAPGVDTWAHAAVVGDGSSVICYLNGVQVQQASSDRNSTIQRLIHAPTQLIEFSNFSIFNTNLSLTGTESITSLYNNGTPPDLTNYSNIIHWWKLNEKDTFNSATGNWTIKDYIGSNNGTSSSMTSASLVSSDLPSVTSGYSPYAIELNGTDQNFVVDNSSEDLNVENVSLSAWFFQDDTAANSSYPAIIINGFSGSGGSYWGLVMRPGNIVWAQLRLLDINGNLTFITEEITQTIVTGQWNHIAMTYDGTTLKGYINGVGETLSLSGASGEIQYSTSGMNSQDLLIGKRGTDSFRLDGKISNFAIWGSGLTSTQIATIYNNGIPGDISSLNPLAWWELGSMMGFNGVNTYTALSNTDSNYAAVSTSNMAAVDVVNGPGYSDGGSGTSSLVIGKQAPYSFNNALSESMAISNRDDSQASDPYPLIMQLDLTSETSSYTFASPEVSSGATYPYTVDWGDGNIEQITSSGQLVSNRLNHVYDTDTYPRPVVQIGKSTDTGGIKQFYVNNGGSKLQFVDLKQWGQANFTNFVSFRLATKTRITAVDNLKFSGSSLGALLQQAFVANPPSINNWDVSTVTNITSAFLDASSFNQDLNNWDTSSQRSGQSAPGIVMSNVFNGALAFNGNITNWFTGKLVTGLNFLTKAFVFNQDISTKKILAANSPTGVEYVAWDVSNCTTFSQFFYRASAFNQDIGNWNIGGNPSTTAVSCYRMFRSATSFNQDIYTKAISAAVSPTGSAYVAWDMSKVNDMEYMFSEGGSTFNGDINNWDTSSVVDMQYMFQQASIFNQDISTKSISAGASPTGSAYIAWDVSSVLNFQRMFRKTFLFNKNLRSWNLNSSVTNMTNMFETTTAMNGAAYTDTIVGWAVKHNIGTYAPNNINMGTSPTFDNTRTQNTDNDGTTTNYSTLYGTDWPAGWTDALSALNYLEEDAGWTNI